MQTLLSVQADPSLPVNQPGNTLTVSTELVPGSTINSEPSVGMSVHVNDGYNDGQPNGDAREDTEMYFRMSLAQALEFSGGLNELVRQADDDRLTMLAQALEFKSAQLSCAKGSVGRLLIVKIADSDRPGVSGFGFYDLHYHDDSGDDTLLHTVSNIECYVPFMEEEQYEWLRALVGGNHQYTASIKIELDGLNLEEIRNEFLTKLAAHHELHAHHDHQH